VSVILNRREAATVIAGLRLLADDGVRVPNCPYALVAGLRDETDPGYELRFEKHSGKWEGRLGKAERAESERNVERHSVCRTVGPWRGERERMSGNFRRQTRATECGEDGSIRRSSRRTKSALGTRRSPFQAELPEPVRAPVLLTERCLAHATVARAPPGIAKWSKLSDGMSTGRDHQLLLAVGPRNIKRANGWVECAGDEHQPTR
jgi:hypothetical protein